MYTRRVIKAVSFPFYQLNVNSHNNPYELFALTTFYLFILEIISAHEQDHVY